MIDVRKTFTLFLDILFPSEPSVRQFDHISSVVLARTAVRTFGHTKPICLAPLPYENKLVRNAVRASKYYGHKRAARLLGEVLTPFVAEELADKRMLGTYHRLLIVPIPLHKKRLHDRGFNQAERIAVSLVQHLDDKHSKLDSHVLVRSKNTVSQTRQHDRATRLSNMSGAFRVDSAVDITGRDVIVVDDVVTTGATMKAAQVALLKAGAREVLCVAAAH